MFKQDLQYFVLQSLGLFNLQNKTSFYNCRINTLIYRTKWCHCTNVGITKMAFK